MTPVVMASPAGSPSISKECSDSLFEWREDFEPLMLAAIGLS